MITFTRLAVMTAVVATACTKTPKQSSARPIDGSPAPEEQPRPDAAPVDAPPEPEVLTFASIDEALGLGSKSPPTAFGKFRLGEPITGEATVNVKVEHWAEGWAMAIAGTDGKIRHIKAELLPDDPSGENTEDFKGVGDAIKAAMAKVQAAWGKPVMRHDRRGWKGATSQLYLAEYGGFLRGTPSLVVDILPPGDDHVCGAKDGFTTFFRSFERALSAKDAKALAVLLDTGSADDESGSYVCTNGTQAAVAACVHEVYAELKKDKAKPVCNLSQETYWWTTVEEVHGGTYFSFGRGADGAWKAHGPLSIGHDDDTDPTSP